MSYLCRTMAASLVFCSVSCTSDTPESEGATSGADEASTGLGGDSVGNTSTGAPPGTQGPSESSAGSETGSSGTSTSSFEPPCQDPIICTDTGEHCLCPVQEIEEFEVFPYIGVGNIDGDDVEDVVFLLGGSMTWLSGASPSEAPTPLSSELGDVRLISGGGSGVGYARLGAANLSVGALSPDGVVEGSEFVVLDAPGDAAARLGDFDGDGAADLLWAHQDAGVGQVLDVFGLPSAQLLDVELPVGGSVSTPFVHDLDRDGTSDAVLSVYRETRFALFGGVAGLSDAVAEELPNYGIAGAGRVSAAEHGDATSLVVANACGDCAGMFANFSILEQDAPRQFSLSGQSSPITEWQGNDALAIDVGGEDLVVSLAPEAVLLPNGEVGRTFFGVSELAPGTMAKTGVADNLTLSSMLKFQAASGPLYLVHRVAPDPAMLIVSFEQASP